MIVFNLNTNDTEALLRHVEAFKPNSGDALKTLDSERRCTRIERSFGIATGRPEHVGAD